MVDEDVTPIRGGDEAKTLVGVEPLDVLPSWTALDCAAAGALLLPMLLRLLMGFAAGGGRLYSQYGSNVGNRFIHKPSQN